jgi:hypothetical protein
VRPEDLADSVPHGPDPEPYVAAIKAFTDAGFASVSIVPVGDDLGGTLRFWNDEVKPALA